MTEYNILIVDDDPDIIEVIKLYLSNSRYNIHTAGNSKEALQKIGNFNFHLIILDVMLPDIQGTTLCQEIRQYIYCPIIFISCIDEEEYILNALHMGGDDYIRKPFNPKELVARVKSNLRRVEYDQTPQITNNKQLFAKDLVIDVEKFTVIKNTKEILLSPLEFDILLFMVHNPNKTLSYSEIYTHVWKSDCLGDTRTLMVHVSNLRKKIEANSTTKYIQTVKKKGYIFSNHIIS
ncbi:response regulator transcription factor [Oceanirhabdus seepicola]|uniref:Stage 0 sporulation protein A homolog n=1 Tax=Oceanirhabdus seepicola TaxID=2828781 RepID=A0A9J6NV49_9CLOT|nr:response regulator transcription factor [Oceanirhabdus seepicola]MCM1988359.1 response regulator transcription factor [Oceanirhabdus seepicola]